MPTESNRVLTIDGEAAKEAVVEAGRKAKKSVTRKVGAGSKRAKDAARKHGSGVLDKAVGAAQSVRESVGSRVGKTKDAALRHALRTCIGLSKKQTQLLEGLEKSVTES